MKTPFCAVAVCAAMLLAGCGGGSDHGNADTGPLPPAPPPVAAADSFFAAVLSVFGKDEDGEPAAIESAAVTAPEGTEPQAVP